MNKQSAEAAKEDYIKSIAANLRMPADDMGLKVAENMARNNAPMTDAALNALDDATHIMELGMGAGVHIGSFLMTHPNALYTAVDHSPLMVEVCMRLNESHINGGRLTVGLRNSPELPYPAEAFDAIFTVNTIYFWEDPATELAELHRLLKPGGRLIIVFRPKEVMEVLPPTRYGFTLYDADEVRDMFGTGWQNARSRRVASEEISTMNGTMPGHFDLVSAEKVA